eukprot:3928448-Rhodomonas_salina.1
MCIRDSQPLALDRDLVQVHPVQRHRRRHALRVAVHGRRGEREGGAAEVGLEAEEADGDGVEEDHRAHRRQHHPDQPGLRAPLPASLPRRLLHGWLWLSRLRARGRGGERGAAGSGGRGEGSASLVRHRHHPRRPLDGRPVHAPRRPARLLLHVEHEIEEHDDLAGGLEGVGGDAVQVRSLHAHRDHLHLPRCLCVAVQQEQALEPLLEPRFQRSLVAARRRCLHLHRHLPHADRQPRRWVDAP